MFSLANILERKGRGLQHMAAPTGLRPSSSLEVLLAASRVEGAGPLEAGLAGVLQAPVGEGLRWGQSCKERALRVLTVAVLLAF